MIHINSPDPNLAEPEECNRLVDDAINSLRGGGNQQFVKHVAGNGHAFVESSGKK